MKILFTVFYDPKDLGIRYLTSYLKLRGHEIHIVALKDTGSSTLLNFDGSKEDVDTSCLISDGALLTFSVSPLTDDELQLLTQEVALYNPNIIGFGTRTRNFSILPRVIPALKKGAPNAFLVCGGAGPSLNPELPLRLGVDAVVCGEGEFSLEELIQHLEKGTDWHAVRNVAYLENDSLVCNPLRPFEKHLDTLPFPTMDMGDAVLIESNRRTPMVSLHVDGTTWGGGFIYFALGSRGCMGSCSYCGGRYLRQLYAQHGMKMPRVRQRSLNNVMEELVQAKEKFNMGMVLLWDEFFVWPIEELVYFFKTYKEKIDRPFLAYLSPDQLAQSPELMDAVYNAGLDYYMIGVQNGDAEFCRKYYHRKNNNRHILYTAKSLYDRYTSIQIQLILGNALQDEASSQKNLRFVAQLPQFDPSFKRRIWFYITKLHKPSDDVPLVTLFPELWKKPYPSSLFYYHAMLVNFRYILDDIAFNELQADPVFKESPHLLGKKFRDLLHSKHMEYLLPEAMRLQGQEVYFWGSGQAYQEHKHLFAGCTVLAILNDYPWTAQDCVDGMNVVHPSTMDIDSSKPLVIFARYHYVNAIYAKAVKKYGFKDIVAAALVESRGRSS